MAQSFRHRLSEALDPEMHRGTGLSVLNRLIVAAILVLILLAVLETEVRITTHHAGLMRGVELALFGVFLAEYLGRLWIAPLNPRVRSVLSYALTPSALLDLLVLASFLLPYLGPEATVFRLLQLARILRLARLGRYSRAMRLLFEAVRSRGPELMLSLLVAVALMLGAATLLYLVERQVQPEAFGSIPRALWWAVETLTTVGYGDVIPVTPLGRLLAALTAVCGIGVIALPAGVLAGAMSDAIRQAREDAQHHKPHGP